MTSDNDWDLTIYDDNISDSTPWYDTITNETTPITAPNFDQISNYKHRTVTTHLIQDQMH